MGTPTPLAGVQRGATPPPGGHQGGPWFDPRGPFPPVLPEYRVGLGTARRRQLVEAGAGLPVRSTTARAQPLAAAATQVCVTPQRGCEGCPPGLRPRLPSVMSTCRRAVGDTCGNNNRQGKRAGGAWGPRARSPAKAQALRGAGALSYSDNTTAVTGTRATVFPTRVLRRSPPPNNSAGLRPFT